MVRKKFIRMHTYMHTHIHTRTNARTRACTHTHTHTTLFFVVCHLSQAWIAPAPSTVQQSLGYSNCPAQWNVSAPAISCLSPVVASVPPMLKRIKVYLYFSSCHITYFPLQKMNHKCKMPFMNMYPCYAHAMQMCPEII